ncbi:MAG TPA: hypothetical protein VGF14_02060 [Alphaproteobacteria bacterium]
MSKSALMIALALVMVSPAAFAGDRANDTSAEVNVSTPDITARGEDYTAYRQANPTVTRHTTTTYTTRRGVGQAMMGDETTFRPYRTYSRTIEESRAPVVTTHTTTYSSPDDRMTLEQEADMLLNEVDDMPVMTDTVIIHQ